MARPIPVSRLPHSIVYQEYTGNNGFNDTFANAVTIENVRVVEKSKYIKTASGFEIVKMNIIFIDYFNSIPRNLINIEERSKITFNGVTRIVQNVDIYTADNKKAVTGRNINPHHIEVMTI